MLSDNDGSNKNKSYLPNFLWLLRDVDSIPVDADGTIIPPTQFLHRTLQELRLKKLATSLLDEYDEEMKEQLKGKYPMVDGQRGERGDTLINIHLQVFAKIRLKLQKEIFSFQRSSDETTCIEKEIISRFDRDIVEYDKRNQVINGRLYKYICENHRASEEYCSSLYREKYENIVYTKLHNALHSQIPTDIDQELSTLSREYFENVSGPASSEVYSTLRAESSVLEADLRLIPGPVQSLVVV